MGCTVIFCEAWPWPQAQEQRLGCRGIEKLPLDLNGWGTEDPRSWEPTQPHMMTVKNEAHRISGRGPESPMTEESGLPKGNFVLHSLNMTGLTTHQSVPQFLPSAPPHLSRALYFNPSPHPVAWPSGTSQLMPSLPVSLLSPAWPALAFPSYHWPRSPQLRV